VEGTHAGQYFEPQPEVASKPHRLRLTLPDLTAELTADRGVFSADAIDPGTRYLLQAGPALPASPTNLLDLGCGYGPIAVTLAHRAPAATVWAVDTNERAVDLTRVNAKALGSDNVRAVAASDPAAAVTAGMPDDVRFDAIWSNPPIRIGKPRLHTLLTDWLARLSDDGHAVFVVHQHLGADSLARWLTDAGWPTRRLGSRSGYRLLDATRAERED
jgi:16S rRNA (guanine1207-N2)-methyltransferase